MATRQIGLQALGQGQEEINLRGGGDILMDGFGSTAAILLVIMALSLGGGAVYFFTHRKKKDDEMTLQQLQALLYEEIKNVCELALVRKNFTSTVTINDEGKKIPVLNKTIPGTSRKFLMNYSGTMVCGFDLSGLKIFYEGNGFKIFLPHSKILDLYADVSSYKVHFHDTGILAEDIKLEEQNNAVAADVQKQGLIAIQEGILLHAEDNAQKLLQSIIESRALNKKFTIELTFTGEGDPQTFQPPPKLLK